MFKAFHFEKKKNCSVALVEPLYSAFQRKSKRDIGTAGDLGRGAGFLQTLALPALIVAGVEQNAIDPGTKRRLPFKGADRTVNFQEGFLDSILGVGLRT
jgi:hypothetical protein